MKEYDSRSRSIIRCWYFQYIIRINVSVGVIISSPLFYFFFYCIFAYVIHNINTISMHDHEYIKLITIINTQVGGGLTSLIPCCIQLLSSQGLDHHLANMKSS